MFVEGLDRGLVAGDFADSAVEGCGDGVKVGVNSAP